VSLAAHALVALALILAARRPTPRLAREETPLEIELRSEGPASSTTPPADPAVPAPAVSSERRPRRKIVAQAPNAQVRPTSAVPGADVAPAPPWLRMRPSVETTPLALAAPAEKSPAAPPRDELGLPFNPVPNVLHHRASERTEPGKRTTPSGLQVEIRPDGTLSFSDPARIRNVKPTLFPNGMVGVSGAFDLNDAMGRLAGNDPQSYEKRKIAEATFEDRLCLARAADLQRKQEALFHLEQQLQSLRALPGLTSERRHEVIFELWDDCVDDGADGQPALAAAARATIVAFIRRVCPPGSPDAFTPNEIVAFNRRRTARLPFDPYGTLARPPPDAGFR
jgi:hypothetical protein